MKQLKNNEILTRNLRRRLVTRLSVLLVLITVLEVLIHSGAFNALVVHSSNVIVGGWK